MQQIRALNIWYVQHYANPLGAGAGERPLRLAKELVRCGHKATVFTAEFHHLRLDTYTAPAINETVEIGGSDFYFVKTPKYEGNGLGRIRNMLAFRYGMKRVASDVRNKIIDAPDVIIVSSPHPFATKPMMALARDINAKFIFEVRDLWPLSLIEIIGISKWHPLALWLNRITKNAYKTSDGIVSLLEYAQKYMRCDKDRFHYIPNGISQKGEDTEIQQLPEEHKAVFEKCRSRKEMIVVYAGSHGPPNALDQLFDIKPSIPCHFILIGKGVSKAGLAKRIKDENHTHITMLPPVSASAVRAALELSDVCFLGLEDTPLYQYGTSLNKLFEYFLASKPIIFAGNSGNTPVKDANAGFTIPPYNPASLEDTLKTLYEMTEAEKLSMGERGYSYVIEHHSWEKLGKKYATICENI